MRWLAAASCSAVLALALQAAAAAGPGPTVRSGWPCAGCIVQLPAGYRAGSPAALLVVLHGDEGAPGELAGTFAPVAAPRNVIVFAPQCPTALGCSLANGAGGVTNSWWGWLQYSNGY